MNRPPHPLLLLLRDPARAAALGEPEWDRLLPAARRTGLLARIGYLLEDAGVPLPPRVGDMIHGARAYVDFLQLQIRRELGLVAQAARGTGAPLLLLKGAAYIADDLPNHRGRPLSDLDIMVPRNRLESVEAALLEAGWESETEDEYDQHYYRQWMHEIPPLKHRDRAVEVDIHHNLLPLTGHYRIDAAALWQEAVPLKETGLLVLSPTDMVLHSAAHLFVSDELRGGLRDLTDIHELCSHFVSKDPDFFPRLQERAGRLGLSRPLYYALQCSHRLLQTPLPPGMLRREDFDVPNPAIERLMLRLVTNVLQPGDAGQSDPAVSRWLLYVRSHWLRMPPGLLASHLLRKALRRGLKKQE